jgi:hypothetical protein
MNDKTVTIYDEQQHQELLARIHAIETMREGVFIEGVHFGEPYKGAGKPVLLKPGAETIMSRFHLWPEFIERSTVEKWDVDAPVFHYRYECRLVHRATGEVWGAGIGSCNSLEDKYRWRKQERVCPKCGEPKIIKGKAEFGGGWLCWAKKGGCGAKFKDGDPDIEGQPEGKVPNDDVFTLVNTLDKMAQKRALVAAVLVATGASAYFTQDVEDFPEYVPAATVDDAPPVVIDNATGEVEKPKPAPKPNPRRIPEAPAPPADEPSELDAHLGPRPPRGKGASKGSADAEPPPEHPVEARARTLAAKTCPWDKAMQRMPWQEFIETYPEWTKKFWPAVQTLGMDNDMAHEALGVESIKDWAGVNGKDTVAHLWYALVFAAVESELVDDLAA